MRLVKKGLVTLIATAAVLTPAGLAVADSRNTSTGLSAGSLDCLVACEFSILDDAQVTVLQNLSVQDVVDVCGVQVIPITVLGVGQITKCSNSSDAKQYAWVKRTR
jgi:hypothetical protein